MKKNIPEAPYAYKKHRESKWHTFNTKKELLDSFFDLKDWNWIYNFEEKFDANEATYRLAESFEDGKECPVYITSDPEGDTLPFFRTKAAWQSYIAKDPYNIAKNSLDDERTLELCAKLLPLDDIRELYHFFAYEDTSWSGKKIFAKELRRREGKRESHWGENVPAGFPPRYE